MKYLFSNRFIDVRAVCQYIKSKSNKTIYYQLNYTYYYFEEIGTTLSSVTKRLFNFLLN